MKESPEGGRAIKLAGGKVKEKQKGNKKKNKKAELKWVVATQLGKNATRAKQRSRFACSPKVDSPIGGGTLINQPKLVWQSIYTKLKEMVVREKKR